LPETLENTCITTTPVTMKTIPISAGASSRWPKKKKTDQGHQYDADARPDGVGDSYRYGAQGQREHEKRQAIPRHHDNDREWAAKPVGSFQRGRRDDLRNNCRSQVIPVHVIAFP